MPFASCSRNRQALPLGGTKTVAHQVQAGGCWYIVAKAWIGLVQTLRPAAGPCLYGHVRMVWKATVPCAWQHMQLDDADCMLRAPQIAHSFGCTCVIQASYNMKQLA